VTSSRVVVCDFDGTIAINDVGNLLFQTYTAGGWRAPVTAWRQGTISSRECLARECAVARVTPADLTMFASSQPLEPSFATLAEYCATTGVPLVVVSDGLDFYIEMILQRHGHTRIPVYANHLTFVNGALVPEFPWHAHGCGRCGNCKRYHVQRYQAAGAQVLYVGDGLSDRCGGRGADILFAKNELAHFCQQSGIAYRPFHTFKEIITCLELDG
jgi:2,3-diketo-5-methylthio-1-phosphopentane phosphatase